MPRRSHARGYSRRSIRPSDADSPVPVTGARRGQRSQAPRITDGPGRRLPIVRVRRFWLRLLGIGLLAGWVAAAAVVVVGYRPGGPLDRVVGAVALLPVAIALAAIVWPPTARGDRAHAAIVWLGLLDALVLLPSIGGIWNQITGQGAQTLLPSVEAAYPWLLALAGTSLYAGLGVARRRLGDGSLRRPRILLGAWIAFSLTFATAMLFAAVAIGNDLALRDRPAAYSRFGPTDPALVPPRCDGLLEVGPTARLSLELTAEVDRRSIGQVELNGAREGTDLRWSASVATPTSYSAPGAARLGSVAWRSDDGQHWTSVRPSSLDDATVDERLLDTALTQANRATFEERGIEFVEGARARHCRIAVDGTTFRAALPESSWLVGGADLHRWRGQLDYWIFADGQLGQLVGSINGDAAGLSPAGVQGTLRVALTATFRGNPVSIGSPVGG